MSADEMANNILAAGAVAGVLHLGQQSVPEGFEFGVELEGGQATNRLHVRFPFLKSPYRVTVERIDDDAPEAVAP